MLKCTILHCTQKPVETQVIDNDSHVLNLKMASVIFNRRTGDILKIVEGRVESTSQKLYGICDKYLTPDGNYLPIFWLNLSGASLIVWSFR